MTSNIAQRSQLEAIFQANISQDYKTQQNRLKETKEKLIQECQYMETRIKQELNKIKETSKLINQAAQTQTQIYHQSLNLDQYSRDLIHFNTLSSYLKKQKASLSEIVASSDESTKPKSDKHLLHSLSNQKRMEKYLQELQTFKLEKEIQYLEKYILVGQAKDGKQTIVYEDIESVTIKEEKDQIQRLKLSIQELQRLVNLSNECGGNVNSEISDKIALLNKQTQRLHMVEDLLERETKQIVQVKDFFKDYEPKEIAQLLIQNLNHFEVAKQIKASDQPTKLTQQELDFIINFQTPQESAQIFKQPYQEVNDLLKLCKTKIKKIKS